MSAVRHKWRDALNLTVLVAGLGYFVDLFDITIFGVVRISSLKGMGLTDPKAILDASLHLYNIGMVGMMFGGVLWGVMSDKKGRLSVLFGSIVLYSLANIANAFVTTLEGYAVCRLIAGIGLAGELGAAITLVAESLPADLRGVGTTIVATLGLLGAVTASLCGQYMTWQNSYIVGGLMGLGLLFTRFQLRESSLFSEQKRVSQKGSFRLLLNPRRMSRYLLSVMLGLPIYFITGILLTFSPEITKALGIQGEISAGNALLYGTIGLTLGDLGCGILSQWLKSRKKAILVSLVGVGISGFFYLFGRELNPHTIYMLCFILGLSGGYWAVLVTMAAEQFGTNLRGTVATTVPNFVRGSAALSAQAFLYAKGEMNVAMAAALVGGICLALSLFSLWRLRETFGVSLDFLEK